MSKGRYQKKTSPIGIILAVAVALAIAMLVYFSVSKFNMPNEEKPETMSDTDSQEQNQEPVTQPTVVTIQRAEAEYEKWLAAAQIVCVSMEYPDFQLEGIYAASSTSMEGKFSSDGAYIIFTSGGSRIAIHSMALEGERADAGTVDISTEAIGYATFDKVDLDSVDVSAMEELALEDLSELISQSLLVSIYTH